MGLMTLLSIVLVVDKINLIFGVVYVGSAVRAGGYCSRCRLWSEREWASLTTCDDIGYVIMACATAAFPFS